MFCIRVFYFEEEVILYTSSYSSSSWTQVIAHTIIKWVCIYGAADWGSTVPSAAGCV